MKLNSADFQRGGFDTDDARQVIAMLAPLGVDLVELSAGNYESPAMTGRATASSTRAREAYFLNLWPGATFDFRRRAHFDPADHLMHAALSPTSPAQ